MLERHSRLEAPAVLSAKVSEKRKIIRVNPMLRKGTIQGTDVYQRTEKDLSFLCFIRFFVFLNPGPLRH